ERALERAMQKYTENLVGNRTYNPQRKFHKGWEQPTPGIPRIQERFVPFAQTSKMGMGNTAVFIQTSHPSWQANHLTGNFDVHMAKIITLQINLDTVSGDNFVFAIISNDPSVPVPN